MILYHGTDQGNIPSILKKGLRPQREMGMPTEVWRELGRPPKQISLTDSLAEASTWGNAVVMVDIPNKLVEKTFDESSWEFKEGYRPREFNVYRRIPPRLITGVIYLKE